MLVQQEDKLGDVIVALCKQDCEITFISHPQLDSIEVRLFDYGLSKEISKIFSYSDIESLWLGVDLLFSTALKNHRMATLPSGRAIK